MTPPADASRCPACGAELTPRARYCEACGHDLAEPLAAGPIGGGAIANPAATGSAPADSGPSADAPTTTRLANNRAASQPNDTAGNGSARGTPAYALPVAPPAGCAACGHDQVDPDGYCENCGARRPAAASHSEVDVGGIAGVSDIGSRHRHNEDAMGLAALGDAVAAVVCDGVSSSTRPDTASTAAAAAATKVFVAGLAAVAAASRAAASVDAAGMDARTGDGSGSHEDGSGHEDGRTHDDRGPYNHDDAHEDAGTREVDRDSAVAMLHDAAAAAQAAAARAGDHVAGPNPPSTTFVAAVVTAAEVTIGWIGDSRAYWLPDPGTPGGPSCLTVDDTLAGQLGAAGIAVASDSPNAGALIRWLGADAGDTEPHTKTLAPPGPGRVIVCSDGLYRYVPEPHGLAVATPPGTPIEVACALVRLALDAGGQDNVTAVVLPYPPNVDLPAEPVQVT